MTDRLRTVSWRDNCQPNGVVILRFNGSSYHFPQQLRNQKDKHLKTHWIQFQITKLYTINYFLIVYHHSIHPEKALEGELMK